MKLKAFFLLLALSLVASQGWAGANKIEGERLREGARESGQQLGEANLGKGVQDFFNGLLTPFKWMTGQEEKQETIPAENL